MDIMDSLFKVQDALPNMRWDIVNGRLVITTPISDEDAEFLTGARRIFEPI